MKDLRILNLEQHTIDMVMQHLMEAVEEATTLADSMVIFHQHFQIFLMISLVIFQIQQGLGKPLIGVQT